MAEAALRYYDKIAENSKNLILILHDLGRFAYYREFLDEIRAKRPGIIDDCAEFADETTEPILGFMKAQNFPFNTLIHGKEILISLFKEFNYIYGRLGYATMDVKDDSRENLICKVDGTKFRRIPGDKTDYYATKITLTVLEMIRILRKAFPKGRDCMPVRYLLEQCHQNFSILAKAVLNFCATPTDESGLLNFLKLFQKVFELHLDHITINRLTYPLLERATELDVIVSFLDVCAANELLISSIKLELEAFLKRVKIVPQCPVDVEMFLRRRPVYFVPGNGTVRFLQSVVTDMRPMTANTIEREFYEYIQDHPVIEVDQCLEVMISRRPDLQEELQNLDSRAVPGRLYMRSDWFNFRDGHVHKAPFPSHDFTHLNIDLIPAETPTVLEPDLIPADLPVVNEGFGIMCDVGIRSAIIQGEELKIDADEYEKFENNVFCSIDFTDLNTSRVSDFSKHLSIGDFVSFKFDFSRTKGPDRPFYFTASVIIKEETDKNDESDYKESSSDHNDEEPRVPPIMAAKPCQLPQSTLKVVETKDVKKTARQRWIEKTIRNPEQRAERLKKYSIARLDRQPLPSIPRRPIRSQLVRAAAENIQLSGPAGKTYVEKMVKCAEDVHEESKVPEKKLIQVDMAKSEDTQSSDSLPIGRTPKNKKRNRRKKKKSSAAESKESAPRPTPDVAETERMSTHEDISEGESERKEETSPESPHLYQNLCRKFQNTGISQFFPQVLPAQVPPVVTNINIIPENIVPPPPHHAQRSPRKLPAQISPMQPLTVQTDIDIPAQRTFSPKSRAFGTTSPKNPAKTGARPKTRTASLQRTEDVNVQKTPALSILSPIGQKLSKDTDDSDAKTDSPRKKTKQSP